MYRNFKNKLILEKEAIEEEIQGNSNLSSDLNDYFENAVKLFCNLFKEWELNGYVGKQKLQKLLFPKGMVYDRKNDKVQTFKVNPVMELISYLSNSLLEK